MKTKLLSKEVHVVSSIASLVPECGGPSRSITSLCSALADSGVLVRLLSLDFGSKFNPPIIPASRQVQTHLVPCRASKRLRLQWAPHFESRMAELLQRASNGLIHDNGLWSFTNHTAAKVSRSQLKPLVLSTRGMLTPWALKYKSPKKWIGWRLFQYRDLLTAAAFHATSMEEAEGIRELGFTQPIAVIPNGVDLPSVPPSPRTVEKTALFLGRIHPVKGLLPLVQAWGKVRPNGWRMIIAGPDEAGHQAAVEAEIRAFGLESSFQFAGSVDGEAKTKLFSQANLFIMPSFTENFGMAVAEALAHGLPVLTTKGTPWSELPRRNCGWWVDLGPKNLADGLAEATAMDDSRLEQMGARGRSFVEENLSWGRIGLEMRSVYEWILGIGPKPACVLTH